MTDEMNDNVGARVECHFDELVNPLELKEHPKNRNEHPEEQVRLLERIIYEENGQGWRSPIIVSTLSGYITKGHGRRLAALRHGAGAVPVEYQDYRNEAEETRDLIADNRIAELSAVSPDGYRDLLEEFSIENAEHLGFTEKQFRELMDVEGGSSLDGDFRTIEPEDLSVSMESCCPRCGFRFSGNSVEVEEGSDDGEA